MNMILALIGAFIYRMRGGMPPHLPRPLPQLLFASPYFAYTFFQYAVWFDAALAFFVAAAVYGVTTLAVASGHGRGLGLDEPMKEGVEPEKIEWPVLFLEKRLPVYWYKSLIMAVSGLSYTLVCGIVTLNPIIALSGLLKAPAYMLAIKAGAKNEGGELLTGALLWGCLYGH